MIDIGSGGYCSSWVLVLSVREEPCGGEVNMRGSWRDPTIWLMVVALLGGVAAMLVSAWG